jgi:hypothetical protein
MEDAQVATAAFYLISAYNYYLTYHRLPSQMMAERCHEGVSLPSYFIY